MLVNRRELLIKKQQQIKKYIEDVIRNRENYNRVVGYNNLNRPFVPKAKYDSIIPLHLYTCWHTKNLPPLMKANYYKLVETNPEITFHLCDENDCREFIKTHFKQDVLDAYDSLIPCSYKSDLWRFCVLFINGGIYMDIKYSCANGFKFVDLTENEQFVRDYLVSNTYTALIVALSGNQILFKCIRQIVENVKNKYYGSTPLAPTGPALLGNYFTQEEKNAMEMYHSLIESINRYYIVKGDRIILRFYDGYRDEQAKTQKLKHYGQLWTEKNIYR
jgi:mannosyltransferase OCH1-like enzyme